MRKRLPGIIVGMLAALVLIAGCGLVQKEEFVGSTTPEDTPTENVVEDPGVIEPDTED